MNKVLFTQPCLTGIEKKTVNDLLDNPHKFISREYSARVRRSLGHLYQTDVLPTHSCTAALEMSALLLNIKPGDEVILPSFTFVSTANAFALFGARLRFVDCHPETLNMDETQLESAINERTRAIVPVHYGAVGCNMGEILRLAKQYGLVVIEDAAQCIGAKYKGKLLGTFGDFGTLSFHNTKNVTSGYGGALIINNEKFLERAKVIWQKGTNQEAFLEGNVDKYTWQDLGSSYLMNDLGAALLHGQLERLDAIAQIRMSVWNAYQQGFKALEEQYGFCRPFIPEGCEHNAHVYYLVAPDKDQAASMRSRLREKNIIAPFHYVPLHLSPGGKKFGADPNVSLPICEDLYQRIIRFPLWEGAVTQVDEVVKAVYDIIDWQSNR